MGAVKSRADKTTQKTEGMQRVTLTPARMTDATVDPKLANEARKRAKSQNVKRSSNSPTYRPHLIRTRVRDANEETKAVFGGLDRRHDSPLADSATRSGKEMDRKLRVFILDLSNPTTKCVFHV